MPQIIGLLEEFDDLVIGRFYVTVDRFPGGGARDQIAGGRTMSANKKVWTIETSHLAFGLAPALWCLILALLGGKSEGFFCHIVRLVL